MTVLQEPLIGLVAASGWTVTGPCLQPQLQKQWAVAGRQTVVTGLVASRPLKVTPSIRNEQEGYKSFRS